MDGSDAVVAPGALVPETADAVQFEGEGHPLVVRRVTVPRPRAGEVLIRVAGAPINPSDLGFLAGTYSKQRTLPVVPGFEGSGTVVAAGPGLLPRLLIGRRVAFAAAGGGSWAEYAVTRAKACVPVGDMPLERAATLIVNPLTALAFLEIARRGGHAALVSNAAASALGRMIARLGRARGLTVINVVRREDQAGELRAQGDEHVLVSGEPDFAHRLRDLAQRHRATLLLDAVGGGQTQVLVDAAPVGSTILAYAALAGAPSVFGARTLIADKKRIEGFYLAHWLEGKGLWRTLRDVREVRRLAGTDLRTRIQARFPLAAAQEGVDLYRGHMTAGKVLLVTERGAGAIARPEGASSGTEGSGS